MTQPTRKSWPTREQWAEQRRTVYYDMDNPNPASTRLADYASPEEIAAAIVAVREMWKQRDREMRKGVGERWLFAELNEVSKQLRDGQVPWRWVEIGTARPPAPLDQILKRYATAKDKADAAWHEEVANTPIDDAAWQEELERRREIDAYFSRSPLREA